MFIPQETPPNALKLTLNAIKEKKNIKLIFYSNKAKKWTIVKICDCFLPQTGWEQELGRYQKVEVINLAGAIVSTIDPGKIEELVKFGVLKHNPYYTILEFYFDFCKTKELLKYFIKAILVIALLGLTGISTLIGMLLVLSNVSDTKSATVTQSTTVQDYQPDKHYEVPTILDEQKQIQERIQENTNPSIKKAKQFAFAAASLGQNPPHTVEKWQQIKTLWEEATYELNRVSVESPNFLETQKLLVEYRKNLSIVSAREYAELESMTALKNAQEETDALLSSISTASINRNQIISRIQRIISHLNRVKPGTTAYPKAQELLVSAQKKLKQLQSKDNWFR